MLATTDSFYKVKKEHVQVSYARDTYIAGMQSCCVETIAHIDRPCFLLDKSADEPYTTAVSCLCAPVSMKKQNTTFVHDI